MSIEIKLKPIKDCTRAVSAMEWEEWYLQKRENLQWYQSNNVECRNQSIGEGVSGIGKKC